MFHGVLLFKSPKWLSDDLCKNNSYQLKRMFSIIIVFIAKMIFKHNWNKLKYIKNNCSQN